MIENDLGPDIDVMDFGEGPDAWLEIVVDMYAFLPGEALLGIIVGAGLLITMYIHSGDMALPTVVLILLSGVLFGVLPGNYQQTATAVMIIGIAAAVFEALRRYVW